MGNIWLICSSFAVSCTVSSARVQLDRREDALSWQLCFESCSSPWAECKSLPIVKKTERVKSKQLPRDRDRQKRERCQANTEEGATAREET